MYFQILIRLLLNLSYEKNSSLIKRYEKRCYFLLSSFCVLAEMVFILIFLFAQFIASIYENPQKDSKIISSIKQQKKYFRKFSGGINVSMWVRDVCVVLLHYYHYISHAQKVNRVKLGHIAKQICNDTVLGKRFIFVHI